METEARLADLAITRKVIVELAPAEAGDEADPSESTTAYQAIVNAFSQHPDQAFRVRPSPSATDTPAVILR